jgi:hypothetical protein
MTIAATPAAVQEPAARSLPFTAARSLPFTDGSGSVTIADQVQPSIPLSDADLTFKAAALRRSGSALTAKTDAELKKPIAPRKSARVAKSPRTVPQSYELPDGRRITVHRGYRDEGADDGRPRAAEAGRRYSESFGGGDSERRGPGRLGGLY